MSTDASDDGLGAVLEQDQTTPEGKTERKVVAYASKILSRTQRRYCTTNKELLVVLDVGAAGSTDQMPSPWVWRTYTKAEIAEMQQNDPEIKEILDLLKQHDGRPTYE